jgi:hypothetical protein
MVGDRPSRDGGAVDVGIPTLLLPTVSGPLRGLDSLLALIDSRSAVQIARGLRWSNALDQ